jgi:hypothetical protein
LGLIPAGTAEIIRTLKGIDMIRLPTALCCALLTVFAGGCVSRSEHDRLRAELEETRSQLESARARTQQKSQELESLRGELARLQSELETLRHGDQLAYEQAVQTAAPAERLRALQQFVAAFPASPLLENAHRALRETESELQRLEQARHAQAERTRAQTETARLEREEWIRQLAPRIRTGTLSEAEWGKVLLGMTGPEVTALLGGPNRSQPLGADRESWVYDYKVVDPVLGQRSSLHLDMADDVVVGVSAR